MPVITLNFKLLGYYHYLHHHIFIFTTRIVVIIYHNTTNIHTPPTIAMIGLTLTLNADKAKGEAELFTGDCVGVPPPLTGLVVGALVAVVGDSVANIGDIDGCALGSLDGNSLGLLVLPLTQVVNLEVSHTW